MSDLMQMVADRSVQRPIEEVAVECDEIFGPDGDDPFRAALDCARDEKKVCMAIYPPYFTVVHPDARFMQSLRLWQDWQQQKRLEQEACLISELRPVVKETD